MMTGNMIKQYNHLALVRREEIFELFKNGIIYPASSIPFSDSIDTLSTKTDVVIKLFDKTPKIEYSINYFILYARTEKKPELSKQGLNIRDLISIIPLDRESAQMGLTMSPSVVISEPIFENVFSEYQKRCEIENARQGIKSIEIIFGLTDLHKSIKKFNEKKDLPKIVSLIIDKSNSSQPNTIWEYLTSYTRQHTYPSDTRGAFLDTMSVVCIFANGYSKDQKLTSTGKKILENPNPTYNELVECLRSSAKFVKEANNAYKDFWKIAPLYFILLNFLSTVSEDGETLNGRPLSEFVQKVVANYDNSLLKPALLMVGITLGYSGTYKMLYAMLKNELHFLA